ncbi:hypothetical protein IWW35_003187 [Coemansia sp. RSA 1878]|nr:hypothetical protein IWW35_003187 [Coemansia sp. RSA 1878]
MESKGDSVVSLGSSEFPRLSDIECGRLSSDLDGTCMGARSGRSSFNLDSPLTMHRASVLFSATRSGATDALQDVGWVGRMWAAVRRASGRAVGDEDVPYLTLLILRLTRSVPGAQYVVHPRVVCVLGGVAIAGPAIAFTVLEKLVADDLEFRYPVFMQILVLALAALLTEALSGRHGLFVRSPPVRTGQLLPLVAFYVLCVVLSHTARRLNSVHGTFQVTQALFPAVVVALLGATLGTRCLQFPTMLPVSSSSSLSMGRIRARFGAAHGEQPIVRVCSGSRDSSWVSVNRLAGDTDNDDVEAGRSGYVSGTSSASSVGGVAVVDNSAPLLLPGYLPEFRAKVFSGRKLAVAVGCLVAIATWSPSYVLVNSGSSRLLGTHGMGVVWARSALNIGLSLASVTCNGMLHVAISRQLQQRPKHSSTAFVRDFAPLCMLAMLVLWPLVEQPVAVFAALDARRLASCIGVALLGSLSWIARIAMLRANVSDGVVGVAVIAQIKPLVCLAIGWWSFGYASSWVQVIAFSTACACLACWCLLRLAFTEYPDLVPVISPHMYRSARSRKYSAAVL